MDTQPQRGDPFSGLQRLTSRYSIARDKLIINSIASCKCIAMCACAGNAMMQKLLRIAAPPARRPRYAGAATRAGAMARAGETVALVPTMGALHEGHLTLVRAGATPRRRVIVSIFVNPAQFAPHEDFKTYPRTFAADVAALAAVGADLVWAPDGRDHVSGGLRHAASYRKVRPKPASKTPSGRISLPASRRWSRNFSSNARPTSPCSARRIFSSSRWSRSLARDLDLAGPIVARADRARSGRARALFAQRLPLRGRTREPRRRFTACSADCADKIAAGEPIAAVLPKGRRSDRARGLHRSTISRRATPRRLRQSTRDKDGPIRLLGRRQDRQDAADRQCGSLSHAGKEHGPRGQPFTPAPDAEFAAARRVALPVIGARGSLRDALLHDEGVVERVPRRACTSASGAGRSSWRT